jgi:PTS system ascorbate-specific IIA component
MTNRILIIAHTPLASTLRQCVGHVFEDKADALLTLDVQPNVAPQDSLRQALALLGDDTHTPVLVLTDIVGATPCNVAQRVLKNVRGKLIAGVNLPMLLRAVTYQEQSLEDLANLVQGGGIQGVVEVSTN